MSVTPAIRSIVDCLHCEHRSSLMFCNLGAEALTDFDSLGTHTVHDAGVKLFEEETPTHGVFVICSGKVKLSATSRQGKTLILKIAVPGDVLGLGAVMSGSTYEVTAETVEPVQLNRIAGDEFLAFLHRHGEASMHAAQALSDEYMATFFDARRLALSGSAAGRLADLLLEWGRDKTSDKADMRFTMALTHEELGSLIGSSRETVTRMLTRFKREKLIQIRGASVFVLAPEKLKQMAV